LVDVMIKKVGTSISVIKNINEKYPKLYAGMFDTPIEITMFQWEYDDFLERIGIYEDVKPSEVWDYIVAMKINTCGGCYEEIFITLVYF